MVKNTIDASVDFDFRGEHIVAAATIELDPLIDATNGLPSLHQILAKRNNIDLLSYHYEIMLEEEVRVNNAQGLVAEFVTEGRLDEAGFLQAWREQKMFAQLQTIAQQHLGVDDLQKNLKLKAALTAAFRLGADKN